MHLAPAGAGRSIRSVVESKEKNNELDDESIIRVDKINL